MKKTDKTTLRSAIVIAVVALIAVSFGCKKDNQKISDDTTIEKMNQKATEAGESINEASKKTADKTKETAKKVADKTKEVASDTGEAIKDTIEDTSEKMSD